MRKHLVTIAVVVTLAAGCIETHISGPTAPPGSIWGSGHLVTESRSVAGFHGVQLAAAGEVVIDHTGFESLTITAEDNLIGELTSEVIAGRLVLGVRPGVSISASQPILYRLTVRVLDELTISGAGSILASGIDTAELSIVLSGAGRIDASGSATSQSLTLSGAGRYEAANLPSREASVTLSGAGHAIIRVRRRIEGTISGSGVLEYYGDPEVAVTVSGSGVVRRLGG